MSELIIWSDKSFNEIPKQDWPDIPGTYFITLDKNTTDNGPKFTVSEWVESDIENVERRGLFWKLEHAVAFGNKMTEESNDLK